MAEFYAEEGIGETRIIRVENGRVVLAWLDWHETLIGGSRVRAKVMPRQAGDTRGLVETDQGEPVLVRGLSRDNTEGSEVTVEILRAAIREKGRGKAAHGVVTDEAPRRWTKLERMRADGVVVKTVRQFPVGGWDDIVEAASTGKVEFSGGSIVLSATPAMTLIDVDGHLAPLALSLAAVPVIAQALDTLELHGSIGIDFPTLSAKADRRKVDEALAEALERFPRERTAMNGFGFVQLVGRVDGPSMLHRWSASRVSACARMAMARAERAEGAGITLLTIHPALKSKIKPQWLDELRRRTGREVRIETDPGLALEAPHAQIVSL